MQIHSIELTNHCNLACGYCPNDKADYPKGFLSLDNYIKALEYGLLGVGISGCGESLLHPDLLGFIRVAKMLGKDPGLNTNGTLLTPDLCVGMVEAGLTHMEISIHTEESYKKYKMLYDLKLPIKVIANVLTVNYDVVKTWMAKDKHYPMKMHETHNWARDDSHPTSHCVFTKNNWCMMKWDGNIVACCFDFDGDTVIGHISDFKNLKHREDYDLCKTCSPSWVHGQKDTWWVI